MKKIAILSFLTFIFVAAFISVYSKPYHYPKGPGSDTWNKTTYPEKVKQCNIPDSLLKKMPSGDLIKSVFNFPFIQNLFLFDDCLEGFNHMQEIFNGLDDMVKRKDIPVLLFQTYSQDSNKISYGKEVLLEIILAQPDIITKFDKVMKNELLGICLEKLNSRMTKKSFLSRKSMKTCTFLMIRLLSYLDNNFYRDLIEENENIKSFSELCGTPSEDTITKIIYYVIRFRNNDY
ncbi:MAG: hypothetical protein HW421_4108 [Ignavibacteria bacterium]|nr:hypothetical protein [Ignavibacteria bacterium]